MAINDQIPNQDATQSGVNLLASAMERDRAAYRDAWHSPTPVFGGGPLQQSIGQVSSSAAPMAGAMQHSGSMEQMARQATGAGEPDAYVDAWTKPEMVATDVSVADPKPLQAAMGQVRGAMPVDMQGPAADRANSYEAAWAENPGAGSSMASETFQTKPLPVSAPAAAAPAAPAAAAAQPAAAPAASSEPEQFKPGATYYELAGKTGRGDGA